MCDATFWSSSSGRIELEITPDQARSVFHSGSCDDDVRELSQDESIATQLATLDPATLRDELREYGAWDAEELADHEQNLQRVLWLAGCDIAEELAD